jgi:hypothetical protein
MFVLCANVPRFHGSRAIIVGGRETPGEDINESSAVIVFDMIKEKITYDYDIVGYLPRRIGTNDNVQPYESYAHEYSYAFGRYNLLTSFVYLGHRAASVPSKSALYVFGGELLCDDDNACFNVMSDLHRFSVSNNIIHCEKVRYHYFIFFKP